MCSNHDKQIAATQSSFKNTRLHTALEVGHKYFSVVPTCPQYGPFMPVFGNPAALCIKIHRSFSVPRLLAFRFPDARRIMLYWWKFLQEVPAAPFDVLPSTLLKERRLTFNELPSNLLNFYYICYSKML